MVSFFINSTNLSEKNKRRNALFYCLRGGATSRHYMEAGKEVDTNIPDYDLDWLGTHATRLNAQLLRTLFRDICYQRVLKHYELIDKNALDYKIVIGGGWKPGWSTDYDAVMLAVDYRVTDTVVNLSDIIGVYDKDPKKFPDAKLQPKLSWDQIIEIVGKKWKPGMRRPFDPIASKLAKENNVRVIVCKGHDLENLNNILEGKKFKGTTIE